MRASYIIIVIAIVAASAAADNPARMFARLVDERLSKDLAKRLGIDTTPEAARRYIRTMSPDMFAAERVKNDQATAARVADALEMVLVNGVAEDKAYEDLVLADIMTVARWEQLLSTSTADHIPTLRTFASAPAPLEEPDVTEQVFWAYITRALREKVCALPEPYNNIRKRLIEKVGGDTTDPLLKNISVFEAECEIEYAAYVRRTLNESVSIYRDELRRYSQFLVLLRGTA